MNTPWKVRTTLPRALALSAAIALIGAGCASEPQSPDGLAEVRARLNALQSDPVLAAKAPVEIREAETAVRNAETPPNSDVALSEHRVYMADQMVEIAVAKAETRLAESERDALARQREASRLDARTREADMARREAAVAQSALEARTREAERARREAAGAQSTLEASRASAALAEAAAAREAAEARRKTEELQRQLEDLNAKATDRGLVLTLGDVLFSSGQAALNTGGHRTLDKLVVFLGDYPERSVTIEGHTDNVGSLDMNQQLSENRAESVKSYLVAQGISSSRLRASGMGETRPVADNAVDSGRQQNRRVELIITNPQAPASAGASPRSSLLVARQS